MVNRFVVNRLVVNNFVVNRLMMNRFVVDRLILNWFDVDVLVMDWLVVDRFMVYNILMVWDFMMGFMIDFMVFLLNMNRH